jgi:hypothetical protein
MTGRATRTQAWIGLATDYGDGLMRKWMFLVALACVQAACLAAPQSEAFNAWLEQQWQQTLQRQPVLATSIGDARYNALLPNTASEAWRAEQNKLGEEVAKSGVSGQAEIMTKLRDLKAKLKAGEEELKEVMEQRQYYKFPVSGGAFIDLSKSLGDPLTERKMIASWAFRIYSDLSVLEDDLSNDLESMKKAHV